MNARAHPTRLGPTSLLVAVAIAVASIVIATALGAVAISPVRVVTAIAGRLPGVHLGARTPLAAVITEVRLPRVVLAALVGAVLSTAGGAYQAAFHNPLADPYLLGVAAGAGLGVTVAVTGGAAVLGGSGVAVTACAFAGALAAVALAYALGASAGDRSGASLILAGVAVAALFSSVQSMLLQRDHEAIGDVYGWLLGRFNTAGWNDVALLAPVAGVALIVLVGAARHLDVLALGDDDARLLGVHPGRLRLAVVVTATLGTAAAVSVSGLIGFVGIVVPHAIRLRVGPSYRRVLPLGVFYGAAFLCLADLAARTLLAPAELPIAVLTAAVGAPFFLWLLRRNRVLGV